MENEMMHNGMPVTNMAQLQAMIAGQSPQPYAPQAQFVTAEQVNAIIEQRLQQQGPDLSRLQSVLAQVDDLARRALPEDDYKALQGYVAGGSPGFANLLGGNALHPIMQLLWETIKENAK